MVDQRSGDGGGRSWRLWLLAVFAVLGLALWVWLLGLHLRDYWEWSNRPEIGGAAEGDAATIRKMIMHENELMNHRLTWLLTTEGLLFTALALVLQRASDWEGSSDLALVLSLAGISVAASSQIVLSSAHTALLELENWWRIYRPSLTHHVMPDVLGFRGYSQPSRWFWWCLSPWRAFPPLFIVSWGFIGGRLLRRTGASSLSPHGAGPAHHLTP